MQENSADNEVGGWTDALSSLRQRPITHNKLKRTAAKRFRILETDLVLAV